VARGATAFLPVPRGDGGYFGSPHCALGVGRRAVVARGEPSTAALEGLGVRTSPCRREERLFSETATTEGVMPTLKDDSKAGCAPASVQRKRKVPARPTAPAASASRARRSLRFEDWSSGVREEREDADALRLGAAVLRPERGARELDGGRGTRRGFHNGPRSDLDVAGSATTVVRLGRCKRLLAGGKGHDRGEALDTEALRQGLVLSAVPLTAPSLTPEPESADAAAAHSGARFLQWPARVLAGVRRDSVGHAQACLVRRTHHTTGRTEE